MRATPALVVHDLNVGQIAVGAVVGVGDLSEGSVGMGYLAQALTVAVQESFIQGDLAVGVGGVRREGDAQGGRAVEAVAGRAVVRHR